MLQTDLKAYYTRFIIAACCLCFWTQSYAQEGFEAGGWIGVAHYFGDLNTDYQLKRPGLTIGAGARYNFNERLCGRLSLNFAQVSAYDSDSENTFEQARNLHFKSDILEGSFLFEFNFLPYIHGSKDHFFTPYLFVGFGIQRFKPQADYNGELIDLQPLGTEGQFRGEEYSTTTGALHIGGGIKFDLNYDWSINIEINSRLLFSDYLDDVSTVYPDYVELQNLNGDLAVALSDRSNEGPFPDSRLGQTGRQRGDSGRADQFATITVGLMYYFGDLKCPTISRKY